MAAFAWRIAILVVFSWPASAVAEDQSYVAADVVFPAHDAAVRSNAGDLTVKAHVEPALAQGHRLQLLLDGVPLGVAQRVPEFPLQNIDRGTHRLQIRIIDEAGETVFTGAASTFHLMRHSRLHP